MPEPRSGTCWACQTPIKEQMGVSLDDSAELHVCNHCWHRIPRSKRILLGLAFRGRDKGGLGLRQFVYQLMDAVKRANEDADEGNAWKFPWRN